VQAGGDRVDAADERPLAAADQSHAELAVERCVDCHGVSPPVSFDEPATWRPWVWNFPESIPGVAVKGQSRPSLNVHLEYAVQQTLERPTAAFGAGIGRVARADQRMTERRLDHFPRGGGRVGRSADHPGLLPRL